MSRATYIIGAPGGSANHGDGNKYASVNLNKSYGYQPHRQYNQSGSDRGNRGRGGGGGGSMVVLSRPRSSQNTGPKLSVPPPLNLPSLRKEHERVDSSGLSFHSGGGIGGSGTRPASSGMGWSKPAATAADGDIPNHQAEGVTRGSNGLNMPHVSRVGAAESVEQGFNHVEKVATLRGEDFPSLKASLPLAFVSGQKQKEGLNQKQKQASGEEFSKELRGVSGMGSSVVDMRPQSQSWRSRLSNELNEGPSFPYGSHSSEQVRKKEYFSGPLPLVHLTPRSDWADDERDTSHGLRDRDRDHGYSKNEPSWDRGFDLPRPHVLPQKHAANLFDKPGQRENEIATFSTGAREAPYQHGGRQPWNNNIDSSSNRRTFNRDGPGNEHQNRDTRHIKSNKPHVEDLFMKDFGDSGFDVHDPFPVLGVAKKKKEALKQTEFHDPVRESFEAELERVQKMQEEERRRIIEEQERVIELARTEEEERLRLAREQDERQRRMEEEAREVAFRNKQEKLEAARRAEELRKSKEEEKHRLVMEEERRKQAAKKKLLELEEKISRRQAEAAKGCSSSSTVSEDKFLDIVKEKESADVVDWEDSERMVDRITTSSTVDLSVPIRSFEINATSQFSRDGCFGFPDRPKPTWRKEDTARGSNSRFIPQNMENVPPSPQEEFFGAAGYLSPTSYFKPGFPEHSVDHNWRIPGDGRTHGRNFGMESESRDSFGWGQSHGRAARHDPYSSYPEKLFQNPEGNGDFHFGRPRYSVRQPRVLPPPQESRQKSSFRSEVEHPGSSTSVGGINYSHTNRTSSTVLASYIGDLQDHHVLPGSSIDEHHQFGSKLARRCDSQSSLSISSPPDSPVHLSHDDLDESAVSSVLATSRKGEDDGLPEKGGAPIISGEAEKDSLMIATGSLSCWDNEEWTLDSNEQMQEQEEYDEDEDGYQEEDKDLAEGLEEMHLEDKDLNLVLGFNEGVEVEIPSDDFEKGQQNSETAYPLLQHTVNSLDEERPSIETSRAEKAGQPVEVSDPLNILNISRSFQGAENTMQNLTIHPNSGRQSFELGNKVDSTDSLHPVIPPHSTGLHPSPLQTAIPPVSTTSAQMEEPIKFQFGLFSGPSLIPSPFPTIQIGSIQMPLPLHPQFGSSLTHIQQPQSPIIQFGHLRYTDYHPDEKSASSKSTQASCVLPVIPKTDQTPASGFVVSNKNKVLDNSHTSVGTWGNQLTYQPVMALTQSQLDEAMKPVSLVSCGPVANGANQISEPNLTSSGLPKNNTFSSSTSPINPLLAEGKIQFGAVQSSTVIPPGGGHTEKSSLYFEKDNKHRNSSSSGMKICEAQAEAEAEAEAEAAASAIAVAAISNNETSEHALSIGSVLPVETKKFGGTKLDDGEASGTVGGQPSLSKAEESLIVSLPADLSVDTPISLWPPIPSPHNSNQMISHFPPGPTHYPFYDINPMLRGPIFAFGPHHDARGNQSQSQKGPGAVSGPPTSWQQQGHSGLDSFYAPPPAGFTGPFLSPPGAISGVQGPPHMFVYNHFAPVGQFGGLSFMGTTYIPSGKQPDWKHNPAVSSSLVGDSDVNNPNVPSMQCNIVPASGLPMPMFDPPPFQSSSQEMSVRARWPYMPFSGPPTMQMQKQQEAADGSNLQSPQFNNNMFPPPPTRYPNIQASTASDTMVDSSNAYSSTTCAPPPKPTTTLSDPNSNNTLNPASSGFKQPPPPPQQQSSQEKNSLSQHVGGPSHQRKHNRRSGFHGRNQPMARERGFPNNLKVKQIYVAKQTGNSNASASSTTTSSPPFDSSSSSSRSVQKR